VRPMKGSGSIKTSTPSSESLPWLNQASCLQESPAFRHGEDVKEKERPVISSYSK